MRKINVLVCIAILASFIGMKAESDAQTNDLAAWATSFPEEVNGIKIFSPSTNGAKIQISDIVDFPALSRERIYINSLYNMQFNLDNNIEQFEKVDFTGRRVSIRRKSVDENSGATYNYTIAFQTTDGMLSFLVYDISISYREKGIVPRTLNIEKMNIEGNRKHRELVESCLIDISTYIARVTDAISKNEAGEVTFWPDLESRKIVNGMNPTEVILIEGRPSSIRKTGSREKWMYGNDYVIIFSDGKVSTIIH